MIESKKQYDAKISDTERKYFTAGAYNKLIGETLNAKIKEK